MNVKTTSIAILMGLSFCNAVSAQETETGDSPVQITTQNYNDVVNIEGLQKKPEYPGGMQVFYADLMAKFKVPKIPEEGTYRIYISFIVEKDGSLTDIKVLKDTGYGLGDEAVRSLKKMKKKWIPGEQNGKVVRTSFALPIAVNISN